MDPIGRRAFLTDILNVRNFKKGLVTRLSKGVPRRLRARGLDARSLTRGDEDARSKNIRLSVRKTPCARNYRAEAAKTRPRPRVVFQNFPQQQVVECGTESNPWSSARHELDVCDVTVNDAAKRTKSATASAGARRKVRGHVSLSIRYRRHRLESAGPIAPGVRAATFVSISGKKKKKAKSWRRNKKSPRCARATLRRVLLLLHHHQLGKSEKFDAPRSRGVLVKSRAPSLGGGDDALFSARRSSMRWRP